MVAVEVVNIAIRLDVSVTDYFPILDHYERINFSKFLDCDIYVKIIWRPGSNLIRVIILTIYIMDRVIKQIPQLSFITFPKLSNFHFAHILYS